MTVPERLDDTLTGNGEEAGPDQSMQWGVRWDNGVVSVERDQEAALVCRVCGPWQ